MNQFFYTLLLRLCKPILLKILSIKAKKAGGVWDIYGEERMGVYSSNTDNEQSLKINTFIAERPVWVHAVSLGETRAAYPFVRLLLNQGYPVLLTHMTATGKTQGTKQFSEDIAKGRLVQAWFPYDLPEAVKGFLTHWQPRCGILIEREVWPNMVSEAVQQKVPLILASARFSESAAKQVKFVGGALLNSYKLLDLILTQSQQDAERFEDLGLPTPIVLGNLKFDLKITPEQIQAGEAMRMEINRPVVVISSTREGEEQAFLQSIWSERHTVSRPLYILVPRHPQRFGQVEEVLQRSRLKYVKRSNYPSAEQLKRADVLLGDSIGEMFYYYGLSDVAIVAGSFGDYGGQNHIEACAVGVPVIVGPHTKNFEKAVNDALIEGAARRAENPHNALLLANQLLQDEQQLVQMGKAGKQWLYLHQGVSRRLFNQILPYLGCEHDTL